MATMQPRPEFIQYRENVPQWRVWNGTPTTLPPFALVSLARDAGPKNLYMARTTYDMHRSSDVHRQDVEIDGQMTYEVQSSLANNFANFGSGSGETSDPGAFSPQVRELLGAHLPGQYPEGFYYCQSPETCMAIFERPIKPGGMGLATQYWPVLTRFSGAIDELSGRWPTYAVADLDNHGVKLHDDGPYQILSVHPTRLPDCHLVWIVPRHIAYRDAWAVGSVDSMEGSGEWQELEGATDAVNSPGNHDVLTIEYGRIVAHKIGIYRATVTAIASGDPPESNGVFRVVFLEPGDRTTPSQGDSTTGSYGWLPVETLESMGHSHEIEITGGASEANPWDRTTSTVTYTREFVVYGPRQLPWQAKLFWNGDEGETLSRVRYHVEYIGPYSGLLNGPSGGHPYQNGLFDGDNGAE